MTKKKTTTDYQSQTDLGTTFGVSAIEIGKILIANKLKYKDTKLPTDKAYKEDYAIPRKTSSGDNWYLWNKAKVEPIIRKALGRKNPDALRGQSKLKFFDDQM